MHLHFVDDADDIDCLSDCCSDNYTVVVDVVSERAETTQDDEVEKEDDGEADADTVADERSLAEVEQAGENYYCY